MLAHQALVLAGPTAVGKSSLAVDVARAVDGEVVSADSRQVFRGLEVGTATPSLGERGGVPHHLIGVLDPGTPVSAGWYLVQARRAIEDCWRRGRPVVVVGGSTLYVHALVAGLADLPDVPPDTERQLAVEIREPDGPGRLYRELAQADPEAAATLDPSKSQRLLRLVGLTRTSPVSVSEMWRRPPVPPVPSRLVVLDRPRPELYARIDARVEAMLAAGLRGELETALSRWPGARDTLSTTIGYRELLAVREGQQTLAQAVETIQRNSRRYAKRQLTWYRRYPEALWMDAASATADDVLRAVAPWPRAGRATAGPALPPTR